MIEKVLNADAENASRVYESANNKLREQLSVFQNVLKHDIGAKEFADIYAQTIAYGIKVEPRALRFTILTGKPGKVTSLSKIFRDRGYLTVARLSMKNC